MEKEAVKEKKVKAKKPVKASSERKRFLGWQKSPAQQAAFGGTTRGGSKNIKFDVKHSTGPVASVTTQWYLVDASQAPVGRVATLIATVLMGKHRPTFTRSASSVDSVVVINVDKAYFTSNKAEKKIYYWHTQFMGGLKSETAKKALERRPDEVLWMAVQGMLPKNRISRHQLSRLKLYKGADHPHKAQAPHPLVLTPSGNLKKLGAA